MFLKYGFCFIICIGISIIDIKKFIIPDSCIIILFLFFLTFDIFTNSHKILNNMGQATLMFTIFSLIYIFAKGFGFGDVKLITVLTYGYGFFSTIFLCLIASLTGLLYVLLTSIINKTLKSTQLLTVKIPFAPFLTVGVFIISLCNGVIL